MYEYTKTTEIIKEEKDNNSKVSNFRTVAEFLIRIVSLFAVYFLLDNKFNFINCIVSLFLIFSLLIETMWEK